MFTGHATRRWTLTGLVAASLLLSARVPADVVQVRPDHPERYTVVKGDTLWDIATRFLKSPWHWPKIWKINEQIANPHLIYPGDVIVMRFVDGKPELTVLRAEKLPLTEAPPLGEIAPTEAAVAVPQPDGTIKLKPRVYVEPLERAIPTIPPNAIAPFLTQPLAIEEDELERAGYVTIGLDNRIALGTNSEFYGRGNIVNGEEYFQVFRKGKAITDPDSGELLAFEALYLGDAQKLESGDPSKFVVTRVKQEILPKDRLLVAPKRAPLPYYFPHAPDKRVRGKIVSALESVSEVGPYMIIAINLGTRDGMEEGHVLRVLRHAGKHRDPIELEEYELPEEDSGLILVFRTYRKLSYALVMTTTQPIHVNDAVVTP